MEDFFTYHDGGEETAPPKPTGTKRVCRRLKPQNILDAMNTLLTYLQKSELAPEKLQKAKPYTNYLMERLSLTEMQVIFLSMLCDAGDILDYAKFAHYLNCRRLMLVAHDNELQELVFRGLVNRIPCDHGEDDYEVHPDALMAYASDKVYERPSIENLSEEDLFSELLKVINKTINRRMSAENMRKEVQRLIDGNKEMHFIKVLNSLKLSEYNRNILLACLVRQLDGVEDTDIGDIQHLTTNEADERCHLRDLRKREGELFNKNLITMRFENGLISNRYYEISSEAKEKLVPEAKLETMRARIEPKGLVKQADIKEKEMYYNEKEGNDIAKLTRLLQKDNFDGIRQRLEENGMRKGFACLFYGAPGTGKTETVKQIAKATGRDILQVNLADLRDKFVGESEKNIKAVFTRYRNYSKECALAPILLFNEADGIISKRLDSIRDSVDQMSNTIQNIILQEMEDLDGILIATTNLTGNMDAAFERRFLYKVCFEKPNMEAKKNLWRSMLKGISEKDAEILAENYSFSGGQIENIARKQAVDAILTGCTPTLEDICGYCDKESLSAKGNKSVIGFK